jgi:hypothetical protein
VVEGWIQELVGEGVERTVAEGLVAPAAACLEREANALATQAEATAACVGEILPAPEPTATTPSITNFAGSFFGPNICGGEAPYRWTVSLNQNGANVTGLITFHACPGGGRAQYNVSGTATSAASVTLNGVRVGGQGPLFDSGTAPPNVTFTWTPAASLSPNYAP